jgi:hypothetical protein
MGVSFSFLASILFTNPSARAANQWCTPYVQIYLVDLSTVQRSMSEIPYFILVVFPGIVLMQLMALVSFVFLVATRMKAPGSSTKGLSENLRF